MTCNFIVKSSNAVSNRAMMTSITTAFHSLTQDNRLSVRLRESEYIVLRPKKALNTKPVVRSASCKVLSATWVHSDRPLYASHRRAGTSRAGISKAPFSVQPTYKRSFPEGQQDMGIGNRIAAMQCLASRAGLGRGRVTMGFDWSM